MCRGYNGNNGNKGHRVNLFPYHRRARAHKVLDSVYLERERRDNHRKRERTFLSSDPLENEREDNFPVLGILVAKFLLVVSVLLNGSDGLDVYGSDQEDVCCRNMMNGELG